MRRTVFYVSDGTAITAETFGRSLMTQSSDVKMRQVRLPFVDTPGTADNAAALIERATADDNGRRPIMFSTIVDAAISATLENADADHVDLFSTYRGPLAAA